jgi:hypothetical protein
MSKMQHMTQLASAHVHSLAEDHLVQMRELEGRHMQDMVVLEKEVCSTQSSTPQCSNSLQSLRGLGYRV